LKAVEVFRILLSVLRIDNSALNLAFGYVVERSYCCPDNLVQLVVFFVVDSQIKLNLV
jgi:hypothetical protein